MYEQYWGLKQRPFAADAAAGALAASPVHGEALARLAFLVESQSRLGLVLGPSGSGKSLVLSQFRKAEERRGSAVALVPLAGRPANDVACDMADAWGVYADEATFGQITTAIHRRLRELMLEQVPAVLILDDADAATAESLSLIHWLLSLPDTELTVVASAELDAAGELGPRLLSAADLRIDLTPWDEAETGQYLNDSLAKAGRVQPAFDDAAVKRLFELSGGTLRKVNQLAQLALIAGAAHNVAQVDEETIESVSHELSTP